MTLLRKLTLVAGTGAMALSAGYFVQNNAANRPTADMPAVVVSAVTPVAAGRDRSAAPERSVQRPSARDDTATGEAISPPTDGPALERFAAVDPVDPALRLSKPIAATEMAAAPDCAMTFDLLPQPNAMIGLSLLAPCQPHQRVVLRHAGLAVTARTSASGALFATLPALTSVADVEAVFATGEKARGTLPMTDFAGVQRFAVQWQAKDAFQVHAFEGAATYDQPGHISASFTGKPGQTGFMTLLGDASVDLPLLAEVYTFGPTPQIELVLEAAVSEGTCGREILGEAILARGGSVEISDVTLAMPDCDAVGDILVLKNIAEAMRLVAAN